MKCPVCREELEREDHIEVDFGNCGGSRERPYSVYWCDGCGMEAYWSRRTGFRVTFRPERDYILSGAESE